MRKKTRVLTFIMAGTASVLTAVFFVFGLPFVSAQSGELGAPSTLLVSPQAPSGSVTADQSGSGGVYVYDQFSLHTTNALVTASLVLAFLGLLLVSGILGRLYKYVFSSRYGRGMRIRNRTP